MAPSSRISRLSLLFLFSTSQIIPRVAAYTQCYYPDGSTPKDLFWSACKPDSEGHSGCCDYRSGDVCQPNGLCLWVGGSDGNNTYRGTCTDRTWKDPACPQVCLDGEEDDWVWTTPCASKADGSDTTYACGERSKSNNQRIAKNCTGPASKYTASFVYTEISISKATRYVPPPTVDPKLFSVFTETYTARVTALDYNIATTLTTTWESTLTSAIGGAIVTPSASGTKSNTAASQTGATDPTDTSKPSASEVPKSTGVSPAVLGGAIGGAVVVIAGLAGLIFFLRKKRANKSGSQRIASPDLPPANGPVGKDQIVPYEISGADAAGAFAPEKKFVYEGAGGNGNAYEMSSAGEKGWGGQNQNQTHPQAAEVGSGDQRLGAYEMGAGAGGYAAEVHGASSNGWNAQNTQNGEVSRSGTVIVSPMTPAPAYGLQPSRAGAIEMDGSDYAPSRPTTATGSVRGRNGVGNA